jgi:hypothetical protein
MRPMADGGAHPAPATHVDGCVPGGRSENIALPSQN